MRSDFAGSARPNAQIAFYDKEAVARVAEAEQTKVAGIELFMRFGDHDGQVDPRQLLDPDPCRIAVPNSG